MVTISKTTGNHYQTHLRNSKMTDEKIMEMIIDGDKNKIGTLFDRYHIQLYNFFCKRNVEGSTSEDLTQNVFVKVIKYSHSFDPTYPFRAWIYRIARNILNDHFSKTKLTNPLETSHLSIAQDSVLEKIEHREQMSQLHQAIAKLGKEDQELIRLSRFEKLKYHEIAPILNLSESGVKMRMYRAMKKLKVQYLKLEKL